MAERHHIGGSFRWKKIHDMLGERKESTIASHTNTRVIFILLVFNPLKPA